MRLVMYEQTSKRYLSQASFHMSNLKNKIPRAFNRIATAVKKNPTLITYFEIVL